MRAALGARVVGRARAIGVRAGAVLAIAALAACGGGSSRGGATPPGARGGGGDGTSPRGAAHGSHGAGAATPSHLASGIARPPPGPLVDPATAASRAGAPIVGLDGRSIAVVPRAAAVARSTVVVWSDLGADRQRRLVAASVGSEGAAPDEAYTLAGSLRDVEFLTVARLGDADEALAQWVGLTDRGFTVLAAATDGSGRPLGAPIELWRTNDRVVWAETHTTPKGAVCAWAIENRSGEVQIQAAAVAPGGRVATVPVVLARRARTWQLVYGARGLHLVAVVPQDTEAPVDTRPMRAAPPREEMLVAQHFSSELRTLGPPHVLGSARTIQSDIEATMLGETLAVGWTDRTGIEPRARVLRWEGERAREVSRQSAFSRSGASTLRALAASSTELLVVWEDPSLRVRRDDGLSLTTLSPAGEPTGTVRVGLHGGQAPVEVAAENDGFVLLGRAATRPNTANAFRPPSRTVEPDEDGPVLVRAGRALTRVDAFRLRTRGNLPLTNGWSLGCRTNLCTVLGARPADGWELHAVAAPRGQGTDVVLSAAPSDGVAYVRDLHTVARGGAFAGVAGVRVAETEWIALLGQDTPALADPPVRDRAKSLDRHASKSAPARRGVSKGALLSVHRIAPGGSAPDEFRLSQRAIASGGVAIAPPPPGQQGAVIAWVAREQGEPQVHLTRVDGEGRRRQDVLVTSSGGDAYSVALLQIQDGYLVAWVDTRDGDGEVYAAKMNLELWKIGREERLTRSKGDASDVTLLAADGRVWAAWSDARDARDEGLGDIYFAQVSPADAKKVGEEVRAAGTAAHSRSPEWAATAEGPILVWIEEPPALVDARASGAYGLMSLALDGRGRPRGGAVRLPLAGEGTPAGVAMSSHGDGVLVVAARSGSAGLFVDALPLRTLGPGEPHEVLALDAPPRLDTALALVGAALYVADEGDRPSEGKIRRASLSWESIRRNGRGATGP